MKVITVSGFTAAGKTTTCRALSERWNLKYVSATRLIAEHCGLADHWDDPLFWSTYGDRVRAILASSEVDLLVNRQLVSVVRGAHSPLIVDSWFLPWLVGKDEVCAVWLDSSLSIRVKKAEISRKTNGLNASDENWEALLRKKDAYAVGQLHEMTGHAFEPDPSVFHLVVDVDCYYLGSEDDCVAAGIDMMVENISDSISAVNR